MRGTWEVEGGGGRYIANAGRDCSASDIEAEEEDEEEGRGGRSVDDDGEVSADEVLVEVFEEGLLREGEIVDDESDGACLLKKGAV
jgi:hypothetical protein